jgi:hypothetical protein
MKSPEIQRIFGLQFLRIQVLADGPGAIPAEDD